MPGPVNMIDRDGNRVVVEEQDIGGAVAQGFHLETPEEQASRVGAEVEQEQYGGIPGQVAALGVNALSGATLGASDVLLSAVSDSARHHLDALRRVNPRTAIVGQIAGGVLPALAAPGTLLGSAPAGIVGRASAAGFEAGRAAGGLAGVARAAGATAVEGAMQSAGAYLADTALADRKLSAEGMFGAIGLGAAFGGAAGGAMLGIERGTIAARRMFARTANADKAAAEAEAAWQAAHQSTIEANDTAAEVAKAKLAQARAAREQADLAKQQASSFEADVRAAAPRVDAYREQFAGGFAQREAELQRLALPAPGMTSVETGLQAASPAKLQELAEAVAEHDAARIELDDLLRRLDAPDIEPGVASQVTVPRGQFDDLTQRGPLAQGTPVDVTTVGKKLGEGTPTFAPSEPATGMLEKPTSIPEYKSLLSDLERADSVYVESTIPAREISSHGYYEDPGAGVDAVRVAKAKAAFEPGGIGQQEPIKLGVTPSGKITVMDGRHRLAAAIKSDSPIRVKWTTSFEPNADEVLVGGAKPIAAREITSEQDFRKLQEDLRSKLTPEEIKESLRFSREYYIPANRGLRGTHKIDAADQKVVDEILPKLDAAIDKSVINEPIITHRGAHFDPGERGYDLKPGDLFTDPGYMSTSYRSDNINRFGNVHFVVTSPSGTKIAAIPSSKTEGELTLARNTGLRITKREELPGGGIRLHATVETQGGAPVGATQSTFTKIERPAGGTQGGSWYKDDTGQQWFGKSYKGSTDRVENEHLANQIYRMFGVDAPETQIANVGGKRTMMSKEIPGELSSKVDDFAGTDIKDGFVIDAWLGNRDVLGYYLDNVIVSNGKAYRIDNGGATIFKATGPRKEFDRTVTELSGMRDPKYPSGQVFGKLTDVDVDRQIANFAQNYEKNKAAIDQLIDQSGLSDMAKKEIRDGLHQRAEWLMEKVGEAAQSDPVRIEVKRVGSQRDGKFEALMPDGPVQLNRADLEKWAKDQIPPGWRTSGLQTWRDLSIERALPATYGDVADNALYVIRPSQVADRGIMGNKLHPDHLSDLRGPRREDLPPIDVKMTKDGRLWIEDGNHRLHVAAAKDEPVVMRIQAVEDNWTPQKGHHDISDRLRAELPESPPATTAPNDDLLSALRATGSRLDSGAQLGKLSKESPAAAEYATNKLAKRADDAAYFRAKNAKPSGLEGLVEAQRIASADVKADDFFSQLTKPKTRDQYVAQNIGRAMREEGNHAAGLARLEREWAEMGGAPATRTVADDVTSAADVITKYERASAKLTEALGPEAPPAAQQAAKAFRDAEATVDRKTIERTTRAVDDHAEPHRPHGIKGGPTLGRSAPKPVFGDVPLPPSSKDMLNEARARKLDADAAFKRARVAETEAKAGARQAQETANATRATAEAARPAPAAPAGKSQLGALAVAAGVADFADVLGIPGIPQPSDIPIIGPLLGLYLKFKALKYAAGRFTGRVAATGDTKAAALAARTKERMAEAVDRTLGLVEKAAPKSRALAVAATTQLNRRLFDDGEPDAPKNASAQELAAVRIREITAAVTRPELIAKQVAREFRGVTDPDLLAAAEAHLMARFEYLNRVAPKAPPPNPFSRREWKPSPMAAHDLAQRLSVINDPASAFVDPTPAKADTVKNVYPALLKMAQEWLIERVADTKHPVPYESRLRNSLLFEVPLDDSLQPDHAAVLATAHAPSPVTDAAPAQPGPPQASIAANTNLSSVYQTGIDRRAMR